VLLLDVAALETRNPAISDALLLLLPLHVSHLATHTFSHAPGHLTLQLQSRPPFSPAAPLLVMRLALPLALFALAVPALAGPSAPPAVRQMLVPRSRSQRLAVRDASTDMSKLGPENTEGEVSAVLTTKTGTERWNVP
jgi:hypothetical protein